MRLTTPQLIGVFVLKDVKNRFSHSAYHFELGFDDGHSQKKHGNVYINFCSDQGVHRFLFCGNFLFMFFLIGLI